MTNNEIEQIVSRLSNLEDQADAIKSDIKDILTEAKSKGYDPAILRQAVKISREDAKKREKRLSKEQILEVYLNALGCLGSTPLGQAAIERAA